MKAPSSTLVLDAAILIAAVYGRSAGAIMLAGRSAMLVRTDRVLEEARRRIDLGLKRPELVGVLDELASVITVVPVVALEPMLADCEIALRDAAASHNGSTRDAHVLALARSADADI